jgi:hypothetical protein
VALLSSIRIRSKHPGTIWCTMVLQKAGVEVVFSRSLAVADFAMSRWCRARRNFVWTGPTEGDVVAVATYALFQRKND